ncbi:MGMT family protein [Candidatus Woesearchaeota archaeon]|nr:MGMT family protein [Candidatus Woesearchaeota archaeon]
MGFSEKIWQLCRKVPRGRVTTYKEIAAAMKSKAYRAVGNALNSNPYSPVVPCHRVVGSNGGLAGFAHGLKAKERLLRKEGVKVKNKRIVDFEKVLYRF